MLIKSILFLAVWTTSSFAEDLSSNDAAFAKRAPMGFQGMRGKKDFTSSEYDELPKKTQTGIQDIYGKKVLIACDIENNFLYDEFDKEVPMEFQNMKKSYLMPDFEDPNLHDDYEKRTPMGFQGMRGKKVVLEDEYFKRAPMGFQGMRGKKSLEEDIRRKKMYVFEYPHAYKKRFLTMGFQGMRGKKEEFSTEWKKRIPVGFQGMRGKKTLFDEIEKRAMGFQGTRGKKDIFENYISYYIDPMDFNKRALMSYQGLNNKEESDKRAPMGFHGMRGKRSTAQRYDPETDFEIRSLVDYQGIGNRRDGLVSCQVEKQSPFQYFVMRHKKNPRWELLGKFVGVRGKKWAITPFKDESPFISVFDNNGRVGMDGDSSTVLDLQ